jgi:hypothetical protein
MLAMRSTMLHFFYNVRRISAQASTPATHIAILNLILFLTITSMSINMVQADTVTLQHSVLRKSEAASDAPVAVASASLLSPSASESALVSALASASLERRVVAIRMSTALPTTLMMDTVEQDVTDNTLEATLVADDTMADRKLVSDNAAGVEGVFGRCTVDGVMYDVCVNDVVLTAMGGDPVMVQQEEDNDEGGRMKVQR